MAFNGCKSLKDVVLPEGMTEIHDGAFARCESLGTIRIPEVVSFMADTAFANCGESLLLQVKEGSYAHKYAEKNGFNFETYN